MPTHDIRIRRILYMHISLRFWFWPFMLLEWSGYPAEQCCEQTSFLWQAIDEQYIPLARSIVLFYFKKHTETRTRISQSSLYHNTDAAPLRYCSGSLRHNFFTLCEMKCSFIICKKVDFLQNGWFLADGFHKFHMKDLIPFIVMSCI